MVFMDGVLFTVLMAGLAAFLLISIGWLLMSVSHDTTVDF